jgi:hypothetical protein
MAPVNPLEALTPAVGHGNHYGIAKSPPAERRRRVRSPVHWPVRLFRNHKGEDTVETITQDLSSRGFYCLSKKQFAVGELLRCTLQIPTNDPGGRESHLECHVLVVRVDEHAADGQYGIACRTEDYRLAGARGG